MMKKYVLISNLLQLTIFLILIHSSLILLKKFPETMIQGSNLYNATIENGVTLTLMLSAFYMIARNFFFQKK
jgi:ethanolamine transporter EutH